MRMLDLFAGKFGWGKAFAAMIPPELANCVADYAERICAG